MRSSFPSPLPPLPLLEEVKRRISSLLLIKVFPKKASVNLAVVSLVDVETQLESLSLIAFRFVPCPYLAIPSDFFHPSTSAPENSVNNGDEGLVEGGKPSPFGLLLSFSCLHKPNSIHRLLFSSDQGLPDCFLGYLSFYFLLLI